MKNLLFLLALCLPLIIWGCSKIDSNSPVSTDVSLEKVLVPFNGSYDGIADQGGTSTCGTGWTNKFSYGEGKATHAGKSIFELDYCILTTSMAGGLIDNGTGTLTAANGDKIYCSFTGTYAFSGGWPPTLNTITGYGVITGGTGRFEGATGYFNAGGTQDLTNYPAISETPSTFWFTGEIKY
jgi:hypothetical protein